MSRSRALADNGLTKPKPVIPDTDTATSSELDSTVVVPLNRLLQIPLEPGARLTLLRELSATPQEASVALRLWGELAELHEQCCQEAYQQGEWLTALEHHDAVLELVKKLSAMAPDHSHSAWLRYGQLLGFMTLAVHQIVMNNSPDPDEEDAWRELLWHLSERLRDAHELPIEAPEWFGVHEEQLVRKGALLWCDLLSKRSADDKPPDEQMHRHTLQMVVRLHELHQPSPEWVTLQIQELSGVLVNNALAEPSARPEALLALIGDLRRLPISDEDRAAFNTALTRALMSLELLAPDLLGSSTAMETPADEHANSNAEVVPASPKQIPIATILWLEPSMRGSPLELDLRSLLDVEFSQIDETLDSFCWHLPKGTRALPATSALPLALESLWESGQRLGNSAFERVAYLAAAWQRRMADRLEALPQLDWHYGLLVELDPGELEVLASVMTEPDTVERVLGTLRREHHNREFWQSHQELPWMQCPPPLESMRRLHIEQGFYASGQAPMNSLRSWAREVTLALGEAELWTDDSGCLGRWLMVAQELAVNRRSSLPALGQPPTTEQLLRDLGGLEVVYVGDRASAVQASHREGRCFVGEPFGLRVLETPSSRWPARPADGFEQSLAGLLESIETLYRGQPFSVLLADCGAYRLPLLHAVHQRYGVAALSTSRPVHRWLGVA